MTHDDWSNGRTMKWWNCPSYSNPRNWNALGHIHIMESLAYNKSASVGAASKKAATFHLVSFHAEGVDPLSTGIQDEPELACWVC